MAIGVTHLMSTAVATDATEYSISAVDIDKDSLILVTITNTKSTTPDAAVLTGLSGATWESVETVGFTAPVLARHQTWRTMVGSSANTVTLTASFGGATQTSFIAIVDMITGCATSGSNGSGAIAQSTFYSTTAATTISISLASTPTQAVYGSFSKNLNSNLGTPTGFTETADLGQASPARRLMACWSSTPVQTFTSTQAAAATIGALAMEFNLQTGGGGTTYFPSRRLLIGVGI